MQSDTMQFSPALVLTIESHILSVLYITFVFTAEITGSFADLKFDHQPILGRLYQVQNISMTHQQLISTKDY